MKLKLRRPIRIVVMKFISGIRFLKVVATPGHADGSVCLLAEADEFLVSGDVLFYESIGRTDLPTGNLDTLLDSIHRKLFTLPDSWLVYPGHGHETTIGHEKINNPFLFDTKSFYNFLLISKFDTNCVYFSH